MTSIRKLLPVYFSPLAAPGDKPGGFLPSGQAQPDQLLRYAFTLRQAAPPRSAVTPTRNTHLPFRRGGFSNLCAALDYAAQGETGLNFFDARGRLLASLPYEDLRARARAFARRLMGAGIARGERLLLIADTYPGFCVAFFGAQYAGVVPIPVSVPLGLGARTSYIAQLRNQIAVAGAIGIVAPDELAGFACIAAEGTTARFAGSTAAFDELPEAQDELRPLSAGEQCYVQFSSGSTRAPRGIDIRQDQLMANIDGSLAAQEISPDDSGVSWLPFYHDMGLIGFMLAPMCAQRSIDLMAPRDFARRPLQWLSLISRRKASITYSPSFGYELVARRARTQALDGIDLSSLRIAGIGADMIQPTVLNRFVEAFRSSGFDKRAFLPSYGMAEVCVGLSFGRRFVGFKVDEFDNGGGDKAREFVVCGRVMPGHRVEIRNDEGLPLGDRRIGRLFVQGPSVMPGYFRQADESDRILKDGWLDTGDLGYWHRDELVITGRAKDLIIVNGRNIWPQDIEWALDALPELRPGDSCAFSVDAGEGDAVVVLVQHLPAERSRRDLLEGSIRQAIRETAGVESRVELIPRQPGLPLTSSGKLSRSSAKAKYLAGGFSLPVLGGQSPVEQA